MIIFAVTDLSTIDLPIMLILFALVVVLVVRWIKNTTGSNK